MAKTAAEYQKAYRERKKKQAKLAGDPTDVIASRTFSDYIQEDFNSYQSEVHYPLEWSGISPDALPTFESDEDPEYDAQTDGSYRGSIGRAERMVGMYSSAATGLAGLINHYKRAEIDRAIAALEKADLSDPAERKRALGEMARLAKMRAQLDKNVRLTIPQYEVKEVP